MDLNWFMGIFTSMIRQSTPILFVALGTLFIQTSGIMNMAGEGLMLLAGFIAAYVTFNTGSVWGGMIVATVATGIIGLLYIVIIQEFYVDQIIMGLSFNALSLGLTTLMNRSFFIALSAGQSILPTFDFKLLGFSLPVYIGFLFVPLCTWFLRNTRIGLKMRAAGRVSPGGRIRGLGRERHPLYCRHYRELAHWLWRRVPRFGDQQYVP